MLRDRWPAASGVVVDAASVVRVVTDEGNRRRIGSGLRPVAESAAADRTVQALYSGYQLELC